MDILHRASKRSHLPFFGTGIRTLGVLSVIGLFIALLVFPSSAVADDMQDAVDQAQSQLSAAEAQMEAIVAGSPALGRFFPTMLFHILFKELYEFPLSMFYR